MTAPTTTTPTKPTGRRSGRGALERKRARRAEVLKLRFGDDYVAPEAAPRVETPRPLHEEVNSGFYRDAEAERHLFAETRRRALAVACHRHARPAGEACWTLPALLHRDEISTGVCRARFSSAGVHLVVAESLPREDHTEPDDADEADDVRPAYTPRAWQADVQTTW